MHKLKPKLNESEIKSTWLYKDKVYVSCLCITYNQESYIKDAIDSFLAQDTKYRFEIIIHDDASTDGTRDILLDYKNRYPSIIKLFFQDENQYSKGNKNVFCYASKIASGKYIALCEGDDYWIDNKKIDNQIELLLKNKFGCVASRAIDSNGHYTGIRSFKNRIIPLKKFLSSTGDIIPTATLMFKKEFFSRYPDFTNSYLVGDFYMQVFLSKNYGIYMEDKVYSYYRVSSIGSWSAAQKKSTANEILNYYKVSKYQNIEFFNSINLCPNIPNNLLTKNTAVKLIKIKEYSQALKVSKDIKIKDIRYGFIFKSSVLKFFSLFF